MEHLGQKFSGMFTCTTQEFLEVFGKFDKDGNGYIEEAELDGLVKDLLALDDKVKEAKQMILEIADANYDGKIDMSEMAALLLPKERFLAQFQFKNPMAPEEFMKIWRNYDSDWNGYIDGGEIRAFVCDILSVNGSEVSPQRIDDYAKEMLELFDKDKDGRFSFYELSRVVKEVDCILKTVTMHKVSDEKFNSLFNHYDRDDNGYIEGDELKNLVKTIIYMNKGRPAESGEVDTLIKTMLPIFDLNKDGKFDKGELRMVYDLLSKRSTFHALICPLGPPGDSIPFFGNPGQDDNGYIEGEELERFLETLVKMKKGTDVDSSEVDTLKKTMLPIFDLNKDGKFDKEELRMVLAGKK